jgi:hypothetical protein
MDFVSNKFFESISSLFFGTVSITQMLPLMQNILSY